MKGINDRFQDMVRQKNLDTISLVNEAKVLCREKEKEKIVEQLLRDGESRSVYVFSVTPIIGTGGAGKTTLATSP